MPNKNYVNNDLFLRGGSIASSCWTSSQNEIRPTGFSGDSQYKHFSKTYCVLNAHERTHLYKMCLFYSKNTVFYVRL